MIPAHNEAARIGSVLAAVCGHPMIDALIVVDDGSSDGTAERAAGFGATVLRLTPNRGKTAALAEALARVQTSHVLLLDADLCGLTDTAVTRLIAPVIAGQADVTLSLRGNTPALWRWLGVDYITGERVLPMAALRPHLDSLTRLPRFGFEVFLNDLIRDAGLRVGIVDWPDVLSPSKAAKRGWIRGGIADLRMLADIFRTVSVGRAVGQILFLRSFVRPPGRLARVVGRLAQTVGPDRA